MPIKHFRELHIAFGGGVLCLRHSFGLPHVALSVAISGRSVATQRVEPNVLSSSFAADAPKWEPLHVPPPHVEQMRPRCVGKIGTLSTFCIPQSMHQRQHL